VDDYKGPKNASRVSGNANLRGLRDAIATEVLARRLSLGHPRSKFWLSTGDERDGGLTVPRHAELFAIDD